MRYAVLTLTLPLVLVLAMASGQAADAPAGSKAKDDGGWIDLFNGENLEGWEKHGGEATYKVEDGAIVGTSVPDTPNTFLCTKEHYSDFILEFEFKGHPELNSGVQFRSGVFKINDRVVGYQNELEDENRGRGWFCGIYDEGRRGWLYPKKGTELAKEFGKQGKKLWKEGDWNQVRIKCEGDHIQTWLNGEKRTDFHDDMSGDGLIGLQVHGVGDREEPMSVRWRNIRLKEL